MTLRGFCVCPTKTYRRDFLSVKRNKHKINKFQNSKLIYSTRDKTKTKQIKSTQCNRKCAIIKEIH